MLKIDGHEYNVRVVYGSLTRSFELIEGPNAGQSLTAARIRDLTGTAYSYSIQIEPAPNAAADYDAVYEILSAPEDVHAVEFVYGQTTLTFEAMITSGSDTFRGKLAGVNKWAGLALDFVPIEPQRQ